MSTYYTPTIDEFHVGFEYEWLPFNGGVDCWHWENGIVKDYRGIPDEEDLRRHRVKHLDKEDIESLGWECMGDNFFKKGSWEISIDEISLCLHYDSGIQEADIDFYIRNKSELKILMKWLNI